MISDLWLKTGPTPGKNSDMMGLPSCGVFQDLFPSAYPSWLADPRE
jgi:hypothetical protein